MCNASKISTRLGALTAALMACAEPPLPPAVPVLPLPLPDCMPLVERLQHLDQPSPLGFSAVELLARIAGESQSPLIWLPPPQSAEYLVGYGPESGRSQLSVRITPLAGELLYRHEELSVTAPEGTVCAEPVLELPVSVSLRSQTLALDETFETRLQARSAYRAELSHRFAPGAWRGGFSFTELLSLDPQRAVSTGPLSLAMAVWEGGSQGSLEAEIVTQPRTSSGPSAEPWPGALARSELASVALWPSAEPCTEPSQSSLPSDARPLGFSVNDVLGTLARESTRELVWSSGDRAQLELSFVAPAGELCQGVAEALSFQASVRLHTSDGRLSAEVPVQVDATDVNGTIGEITVRSLEAEDSEAPVSFTGFIGGPSGASSQLRVDLDASFQRGLSAGNLVITGVRASTSSAATNATSELASARWTR